VSNYHGKTFNVVAIAVSSLVLVGHSSPDIYVTAATRLLGSDCILKAGRQTSHYLN
jgi:hypothetical protein